MPSINFFNEVCVKITSMIYFEKNLTGVRNPVYFRLCIDLIHITPPVTAAGFDGSHYPRYAECLLVVRAEIWQYIRFFNFLTSKLHNSKYVRLVYAETTPRL